MSEITFVPPNIHLKSKTNLNEIHRLLRALPIPKDSLGRPIRFEYGTAGFRCNNELLPPVMIRIAILAGMRSSSLNGEPVGIMITASHNPEIDNGVKLSDSNGGMLPLEWEQKASQIANSTNPLENHDLEIPSKNMIVHIGRDTRAHSYQLSCITVKTLVAMGAKVIDHGCVTTPQLHYYTLRSNPHHMPNALGCGSLGTCFEKDYMSSIIGSYVSLLNTYSEGNQKGVVSPRQLMLDCACGVGGLKIDKLNAILESYKQGGMLSRGVSLLNINPVNLPGVPGGSLNNKCGAEFVQKRRQFPEIYGTEWEGRSLLRSYAASLDGDADRIVFHFQDSNGKFLLLDGDKIAVLVSSFVQEELRILSTKVPEANDVRCGIVQTAYANGSSTDYLKVRHCSRFGFVFSFLGSIHN